MRKLRQAFIWGISCCKTLCSRFIPPSPTADISPLSNQQLITSALCIIGSGPAAHTATIYAARALLRPLLLEGPSSAAPGGQLSTAADIQNFPGFSRGISGADFARKLRQQSLRFGARILAKTVTSVDFSTRPFRLFTHSEMIHADCVIVATGGVLRRLSFKGSEEIKGISDREGSPQILSGKALAVIGGGDAAMEKALFLSSYGSRVYVIHRRDRFRASKVMQKGVLAHPNIEIVWNSVVQEACGDEMGVLVGLKVKNVVDESVMNLPVAGLFVTIGHEPATQFLNGQLKMDADGYVVTEPGTMRTSVAGVFAAGEVQDKRWRQAITAASTGCMAALEAQHFLQEHGIVVAEP